MKKNILPIILLFGIIGATAQENTDHDFDVIKNLDVFNVIYKHLDMMYVDTLDANEVIVNGINAMFQSLDPYTTYYPEEKITELKYFVSGSYAGIGSIIRYNSQIKRVIIDEPYEGMPAAEAGLKRGDIILAIDDEDMTNATQDVVSQHLRGEAGTTFVIKILRPSTGKTMKMKITRKTIQSPSVPYYTLRRDSIGYINLNSFNEGCSKDFRRAFIDLRNQGMKGLVFDLRNNRGGSEMEAVNIVNMFVPKGKLIVSNRGKMKRANHDYMTTVEPIDTVMPIVVLVNSNSASSSEITSGALQDLDRAVIMGTRTYGKGLVQMTLEMPYNGILKLTTNKYYIPSGRCIQAINYKHDKGGYIEHVPDSLTKVFHTANGREVRDGGGIKPDVEIKPDSMTNLVYNLVMLRDSNEILLNYVLDYVNSHPTIAAAEDFEINDTDFDEFKRRVLKSNFNYDHATENYMDELEKLAKFEGYYDDTKEDFDNLRKKLRHNVEKDLDFNQEVLKEYISNEIVTSYYYQKGAIANSLRKDKDMLEAVRLLIALDEYKKILQP
ncbi:MAG: S41 family peptidase [Prevotella sp.]|nr:S41 family peptidase [Prevotella sp.]